MGTAVNLQAALEYLKAGYSVIPVGGNKKPLVSWLPYQQKLPTEGEIKTWWDKYPNANVGIITGKLSGVCVIDCDTPEGQVAIDEMIPESLIFPVAVTPRGGKHYYFKMPNEDLRNNAGAIPGADFRGEGGYAIAPPSVNGTGTAYRWIDGLELGKVALAPLPNAYKNFLINIVSKDSRITSGHTSHIQSQLFTEGRRDNDLFHLANCLVKGGAEDELLYQVLMITAQSCVPPFPEKELYAKIESAFKRSDKRDAAIADEVRRWVLVTSGHFLVTDCHKDLNLITPSHKHAANVAFTRLVDEGLIERYGSKRGCYRLIEHDAEVIDFLNAPDTEFVIDLPLNLSSQLMLYPGNVGIFAGAKSSGKTTIALDIVKRNQHRYDVVYLNSEMHDTEMKKRLLLHGDMRLTEWRMKALRVNHDWADYITVDRKLFIIDYVETVESDAWRVGAEIKKVHDKLKDGVAIIFLQKKSGEDLARGGQYTLDKARFYVALDKGKAKIIDCKAFRGENPNGKTLNFKIVQGSKIIPQGEWEER